MLQSKMTDVRQDSSQQNQSQRWIKTFVGAILVALLLFVLFKWMLSLSKDVEESRKSLEKFSSRLAMAEKENENLRKELEHNKAKMENMLQVFSNMQKVPRVRRAEEKHKKRCQKLKDCMEQLNKDVNCTVIKNCMSTRGKDFIHVFPLRIFRREDTSEIRNRLQKGLMRASLKWQGYLPSDNNNIAFLRKEILIQNTSGTYFVYCRLRVSQHIKKVIIWKNNSVLFSSWPTFSNDSRGNYYGDVQMFGLAEIPRNTSLYVQVEFKDKSVVKFLNDTPEGMNSLFPDYVEYADDEDSPVLPDRNINSFGVFLVG